MKTLYLLRHAKSGWKDSTLPDFDRPLTKRGQSAAQAIGHFMRKRKLKIDLVLCSPAARARETIEIALASAGLSFEVRFDERIYEAGPARLLDVVSQVEEEANNVLLVGHNPGLEELVHLLTDKVEHFPTGALAQISIGEDKWGKLAPKKCKLDWLVKPKELEAG